MILLRVGTYIRKCTCILAYLCFYRSCIKIWNQEPLGQWFPNIFTALPPFLLKKFHDPLNIVAPPLIHNFWLKFYFLDVCIQKDIWVTSSYPPCGSLVPRLGGPHILETSTLSLKPFTSFSTDIISSSICYRVIRELSREYLEFIKSAPKFTQHLNWQFDFDNHLKKSIEIEKSTAFSDKYVDHFFFHEKNRI